MIFAAANLSVGDIAEFNVGGGYLSIGKPHWALAAYPAWGACFYAIARACAARTPNAPDNFTALAILALGAFLVTMLGSAVLYDTREAPSQTILVIVVLSLPISVIGLFGLAWAASAALARAERPGPPPRASQVLATFLAATLFMPIAFWFMKSRIDAILELPRRAARRA